MPEDNLFDMPADELEALLNSVDPEELEQVANKEDSVDSTPTEGSEDEQV